MFATSLQGSLKGSRSRSARGFSMLELLIVVGIGVTLAAIAVPTFVSAYYDIRLKSAASDLSGFLQQARIRSARQNTVYAVRYQFVAGAWQAYLDLNNSLGFDPGEPSVRFSATVRPAAGAPGGNPPNYVLVGDSAGVAYDNATTLAYSARGLPCAYAAPVCNTPAGGYFVYYLQDQRPTSVGWAAVIVTRSGRSKVSLWNGTVWQ
jgi:prepilin-type N-terminal cleavage/methylation domain-containing protein